VHPAPLLQYLRVPLHTAPLIAIGVFGVFVSLAEHAGLLGVPALAILGSWFLTYGFAVLDHVLDGRPEAPVLSYEMANPLAPRPLGTFLVLLAVYFSTDALRPWLGDALVLALRLVVLALIPAMVAAMALSGRFSDGLHPGAVFGIIARIPVVYSVLVLGIAAVWFLAELIVQASGNLFVSLWHADSLIPGQIYDVLGFNGSLVAMFEQMIFMYLWLTTFALIGGSLYEERLALGIDVAASPERKAARATVDLERQRDKMWDQVFAQVRIGAWTNARESVRKLIAESRQPVDECRWLYARAAAQADQRLANYLAQLSLPRLIETRATGEAVGLVRERLARNPDFRPQTSGQLLALVRLARDAGDRRLARQLLADFAEYYANDPMQPVAEQLQSELQR
jgi:hypothetical protein